ncbi:cytochrome b/b6 domain-containing protein [Ectothiorhodospira mobilis]|uniref:cytochrome b/b6 domain-containing protein n=1 Tax=Ectothiorhodospira mobilis TaxID=195064 RepID=UPI00190563C3|nr:cytochrome b/b6 domain-containing protein [Ectothiorhodospira mobilis]MBK1692640.1 cytochrome B [Ectothiorhodospira mobilis]
MTEVRVFTLFERFWHWAQAAIIFGLLFTGLEIHGTHQLLGYDLAFSTHVVLAWCLIALTAFAIFWHLVTGEWHQYLPSYHGIWPMVLYYTYGIFSGEHKPYTTTPAAKHNPLQRLAYFGFKAAIAPALWLSGLILLFDAWWRGTVVDQVISFAAVAYVHVAATFAMMVFIIAHVYLAATTGHPWYAYLKSMVTGYKEMD